MSPDAVLLRATLYTSAAVLISFVLRRPLRHWMGAVAAYAIWASVPLAVVAAIFPDLTMHPALPYVPPLVVLPSATGTSAGGAGGRGLLAAVWLAGAMLMAIGVWRGQRRFVRSLGPLVALNKTLWVAAHDAGLPVSLGLRRPRIVLPLDFTTRYSEDERALILAHERQHLQRHDLHANALAIVLLCLGWFNPLLHLAWRAFRLDQELACDAAVMARYPEKRRSYAGAMLKCQLGSRWMPLTCRWTTAHPLTQRLAALRTPAVARQRARRNSRLVVALIAIVSLACWVTQPARLQATPAAGTAVDFSKMQPPRYPAAAVAANIAGVVELQIEVSPNGVPGHIVILYSQPSGVFDQSVLEAARSWRFTPLYVEGRAVTSKVRVPVRFELDPLEDSARVVHAIDSPRGTAQPGRGAGCPALGCTAQETL
ncbi:TonB family protein [Xanthomonas melonis]|uniref:TonB family protein n=1 Tax=Xanthomonas melonis TaxID=56456 RepID=A0ABS8NYR4_9XANT|nr:MULTISPECIES: TonB family protein [Xanthomonas]MCC4586290.1 TonB family protein [Xanthomonas sp. NCPPB 1067]MCD0247174.1 TonB family protein [Xanthomonas melonis]MCD0259647.1 TonB family protein [Xanthomonas melonis]MCD0268224.1 TonB family protein [Xanthomonas melonis]